MAHSFNEGQIEWFKAGSALNLVCRSNTLPSRDADSIGPDGREGQGKTMKELSPLHKEVIKLERFSKALLDHKPSQKHSSRYSLRFLFDI